MILKKLQETGRTMVEMLAVLGVVGLLSVAGIQGYRYLNLQFELSLIEDTIYKSIALIDSKQIRSIGELEAFYQKARMGLGRAYTIEEVTCETQKRGTHCYAIHFANLHKNIVMHFMNDAGPFTATSSGNTQLTLTFKAKKSLSD